MLDDNIDGATAGDKMSSPAAAASDDAAAKSPTVPKTVLKPRVQDAASQAYKTMRARNKAGRPRISVRNYDLSNIDLTGKRNEVQVEGDAADIGGLVVPESRPRASSHDGLVPSGFGDGGNIDLTGNPDRGRFGTLTRNFASLQMDAETSGSLPDKLDTTGTGAEKDSKRSSWRKKLSVRKKKKSHAGLDVPTTEATDGNSSGGEDKGKKKSPGATRRASAAQNHVCEPMDIGMSRCACGNSW